METGTITNNKKIITRLFVNAFFVMCFLEIMNSAASLIDSYFMGNYIGTVGMAAMGYARPFFSFVDIICGPLGLGMQLVCSHYIGKAETDRAQKTFSGSFTLGILASLVIMVLGLLCSRFVVNMYGTGENVAGVIPLAESYLKGLFIGTPAMIAFGIMSPIAQLGNGKRVITFSILAQVVADVIGDALSVFVFHGGTFGLGLATAISYFASLIPILIYFSKENAILQLKFSFSPFADMKDVMNAGMSKAIKRVCNTIKPIILNGLSLVLGTSLALSVYSVTNQLRDLLISFSAGTAGAVVLIGAMLYSQYDKNGLECLAEIAMKTILFISGISVLCIIFARPIAGIFISDSEEVLNMAAMSIRCVGIMIPFSTFNGMFISFMQISKRYKAVNILSYLNRLILIVVISALFGVLFGINGLWLALPASEIVNAIICVFVVRHWTGKFPKSAFDLMCLDKNFGYRPEDYIEISVHSAEEVASLLDSVKVFCKDHGVDSKRTLYTQIALEELANNVIEHGFTKTKIKDPVIHIWITYIEGELSLRFQDNCPGFNVMKLCSELKKEGPERCVGLRLVSGISKEMRYINALNTNNLVITI
ncbi:MAG: ATP-binding protein [Lachnospiraceae bacterium]|nr:ATP-binding protein [Lachnospiraceae bacterium]